MFKKLFKKGQKDLDLCAICHEPIDERHAAQLRIPVKGGFLMLEDCMTRTNLCSHRTVDLENFQEEVISRGDTKEIGLETLQYLIEVAQTKADSLDWSFIKGIIAKNPYSSETGSYLSYMFLLTENARKKAREWIEERYRGERPEQTTEGLISMLRKEVRVTISQNIVDRLADLGDIGALTEALPNSCEYIRPRGLSATGLTIRLAEALGRIGEDKSIDAINWVIENASVQSGPWLKRLETIKKWIKIISGGNFELVSKVLEQLLNEKLFTKEGYHKLIGASLFQDEYIEWRWCAYILERRGNERIIPLLKRLYDLIDFEEKPRVMKIIRLLEKKP